MAPKSQFLSVNRSPIPGMVSCWYKDIWHSVNIGLRSCLYEVRMSQVFYDIAQFESFTDLNLFQNAFNVIQNWEMVTVQFYSMVLIFFSSYDSVLVEGNESSRLRIVN